MVQRFNGLRHLFRNSPKFRSIRLNPDLVYCLYKYINNILSKENCTKCRGVCIPTHNCYLRISVSGQYPNLYLSNCSAAKLLQLPAQPKLQKLWIKLPPRYCSVAERTICSLMFRNPRVQISNVTSLGAKCLF